ncbi:MAG: M48 family metallopeptidase [Candidatus Heimdallarchaeum endolithica]|uniref:M48 family metallopeptidase n=1 Tax=Candidatus Heimdallarchaeum endolithica TaxID=2876572 RepID=A0A9Y1BSA4_9ARCH|nr:MAG: M48 family metallopeptidase [Candidatus Heimdallarchaeum endolithica]
MRISKNLLKLKEYSIPYFIELRDVKYARIEILPTKKIRLIFPKNYENIDHKKILNEHKEWLKKRIQKIDDSLKKIGFSWNKIGEHEIVFGKRYQLKISHSYYDSVFFEGSIISVSVRDTNNAINYLRSIIYAEFSKKVETFTNFFAKEMNVEVKKISIKKQKRIWGSCSTKGNININFRAAILNDELLMFLIAHEVAHLQYPNHGSEFKQLLSSFFEDIKEKNELLEAFWFISHSSKIFSFQ